jgi:Tol biopolymer transport system component
LPTFLRCASAVVAAAFLLVCADTSRPARAAFPGSDGKIAYVRQVSGSDFDIYAMNSDGSDQVDLTNNPGLDSQPAWSADGRQIAFVSERDGNDEIYRMSADGTGQTRLTVDPAHDTEPAWTNDGRIVFERWTGSEPCTGSDIYIMNADGTGLKNLTNDAAGNCEADVSQYGAIVFSSFRDGNGEIYSMRTDGTGLARFTNSPTCELAPNWSRSSRLLYLKDLTPDCNGDNDIYAVGGEGTGETQLTHTPSRTELHPTWSPQGNRIAFEGCAGGACQIYVMSAAGTDEVQLAAGAYPAWQPLPRQDQTITFAPLANKTYGERDFTVSATASSGLPVSFATAGDCTISGATIHITRPGSCAVTASQPGDANYNEATDVLRSFAISPPRCAVPRIVGKALAAAKSALKQKHCATGRVSRAYSKKTKKGRVSSQSRRPGQVLPDGAKVNVVVSRGRKP